jgi:hypothetical protein
MSSAHVPGLMGRGMMSTPRVTEIIRRPEPVVRDTFIDDLRTTASAAGQKA